MLPLTSTVIASMLAQCKHPDLPTTLADDITDWVISDLPQTVTVNGCLPYLIGDLASIISDFLSEKLGKPVSFRVDFVNPHPSCYQQISQIILVASGKGGVGKSTVALNLAISLAQGGAKVGLLDADIYGPSIPLMMGMQDQRPDSHDGKVMQPLEKFKLKVNSIGFLVDANQASIWRGPMASAALSQLIVETDWGELDYLIVDMPPGTGDIPLTLAQKLPCSGAVVVTTPQTVALADATKGVAMFNKVNIPVLGIVENMSYFQCGQCGHIDHVFGRDGAVKLSNKLGTKLLGQLPLATTICETSDQGTPIAMSDAQLGKCYQTIAMQLAWRSHRQLTMAQGSGVTISVTDH